LYDINAREADGRKVSTGNICTDEIIDPAKANLWR